MPRKYTRSGGAHARDRAVGARDPAGGPLRAAVLALLEAERDTVAGMLEADGAR